MDIFGPTAQLDYVVQKCVRPSQYSIKSNLKAKIPFELKS